MKTEFNSKFRKHYKSRIVNNTKLLSRTEDRIRLFKLNPQNPILKDHQLTGDKKEFRAFWITGDIRIMYFPVSKQEVLFIDIGTHNQVY